MADGNVAEQGSHDELLARRGLYFDLLRREAGGGADGGNDGEWPSAADEALGGRVVALERTADSEVASPQ
eukprot:3410983-Prymnesium_polylepis.1